MGVSDTSLAYAAVLRALSVLLCVTALALASCGGDDDDSSGSADKSDTGSAAAQSDQTQGSCRDVEQPPPRDGGGQKKPKQPLDNSKKYDVTLETTCGSFTIRLDQKTSPNAAASFVALAKAGFFDDTIFHRIVPGFVIQGGDPTASGTGGPGYSTRDPVPENAAWRPRFASTSTFASSTLPARAVAARSSAGVSCLQGPHQSAQKSTTTGSSRERSSTRCWKSASPTS